MEEASTKEIKENKWKEREEKQAKWITKLGSIVDRIARKCVEKHVRVEFITA
jgi:hypothetical protein